MITSLSTLHFPKEVIRVSCSYNTVCLLSVWCLQPHDTFPFCYGFSVSHIISYRKSRWEQVVMCYVLHSQWLLPRYKTFLPEN